MASVTSSGASPLSGSSHLHQTDDEEDSWIFPSVAPGSNPDSFVFLSSPVSGSLGSYVHVGHDSYSPQALPSPYLDANDPLTSSNGQSMFNSASFGDSNVADSGGNGMEMFPIDQGGFSALPDDQLFMTQNWLFNSQQINDLPLLNPFSSPQDATELPGQQPLSSPQLELQIPRSMQTGANEAPWEPLVIQQFTPPPSAPPSAPPPSTSSISESAIISGTSGSLMVKPESPEIQTTVPVAIRKVKGAGARVGKNKKTTSESSVSINSGSSRPASKFVIVTPNSISAQAGKPNPYECFEEMRPSQRGRKGPLADVTKRKALQVRRLGACFCCHARKVKCDMERPCKNCKKLCVAVPQVVCWQFQDFLTVLFPDFIRGHFRKDQVSKFISENVESFTVHGQEMPLNVVMFSGAMWSTRLSVRAKQFTPMTAEILQHWHYSAGVNGTVLEQWGAASIGLEMQGSTQRDELRKKIKEYVNGISQEPTYVAQVTDGIPDYVLKHPHGLTVTNIPRTVLGIAYVYAQHTGSPIVKRALSIYAYHYVLAHHLTLSWDTLNELESTGAIPLNRHHAHVTTRVLNRQIKAVMDELMQREVQLLFESFSKSLKPKVRKEWAPCLAAFLVLCLLMEAIETIADVFAVSENEIDIRNKRTATFRRDFALSINREVENLPFKQFAFQFHQIYQTHSKDASTKSFNPILDNSLVESGDLDTAAVEMVLNLRSILQNNRLTLDSLSMEPMLTTHNEAHPWPRDTRTDYSGRILSKFLLSFTDEKYILEPKV